MKAKGARGRRMAGWLGLACLVLVVSLGGGCRQQAPPSAQVSNRMTHDSGVSSVAFSPDGKTLASGGGDAPSAHLVVSRPGEIKLWNVATGKEQATLTGDRDSVWSVAYSPDGKTLASGSVDDTIKLWD